MKEEQTQEHMRTGRSCMREDGKSYKQKTWRCHGETSMRSGIRGPSPSFQSGLVKDQAKRMENLTHLKMRMLTKGKPMRRTMMMRRNMKRKKNMMKMSMKKRRSETQ